MARQPRLRRRSLGSGPSSPHRDSASVAINSAQTDPHTPRRSTDATRTDVMGQGLRVPRRRREAVQGRRTPRHTARADVLAFTGFPRELWRQIWSNNPTDGSTARSVAAPTSSGSSPDRDSVIRLAGAVLAEQHDKWDRGPTRPRPRHSRPSPGHRRPRQHLDRRGGKSGRHDPGALRLTTTEDHAVVITQHVSGLDPLLPRCSPPCSLCDRPYGTMNT